MNSLESSPITSPSSVSPELANSLNPSPSPGVASTSVDVKTCLSSELHATPARQAPRPEVEVIKAKSVTKLSRLSTTPIIRISSTAMIEAARDRQIKREKLDNERSSANVTNAMSVKTVISNKLPTKKQVPFQNSISEEPTNNITQTDYSSRIIPLKISNTSAQGSSIASNPSDLQQHPSICSTSKNHHHASSSAANSTTKQQIIIGQPSIQATLAAAIAANPISSSFITSIASTASAAAATTTTTTTTAVPTPHRLVVSSIMSAQAAACTPPFGRSAQSTISTTSTITPSPIMVSQALPSSTNNLAIVWNNAALAANSAGLQNVARRKEPPASSSIKPAPTLGGGNSVTPKSEPMPVSAALTTKQPHTVVGTSSVNCNALGGNLSPAQASSARMIDMGKRLMTATREGDTDTVRKLVASSATFTSDWLGTTALHIAAQHGYSEIAEILLRGGVNRDARTKIERTALHLAAQSGSLDIVDMLLLHGSDVNARDMLKMTPLHWAVQRAHVNVAERLLLSGADMHAVNKFRLTPIDIAQTSGSYRLLDLFRAWLAGQTSNLLLSGRLPTGGGGGGGGGGHNLDNVTAAVAAAAAARVAADQAGSYHATNTTTASSNFQQHQNISNQCVIDAGPAGANGVAAMNAAFANDCNIMPNAQTSNWARGFGIPAEHLMNTTTTATTNAHYSSYMSSSSNEKTSSDAQDFFDIDFSQILAEAMSPNDIDDASAANLSSQQQQQQQSRPRTSAGSSSSAAAALDGTDADPYIDLVELEWNTLKLESDLLMTNDDDIDDDEPNLDYLMKVVEELKKENRQLRQKVELLTTSSP